MAIPAPFVTPLAVPGGTHTYVYNGAIGSDGPELNISLIEIPLYIRQDPKFKDMLFVTFKSLDDDISAAGPAVLTSSRFHNDGVEVNAYVTLDVTAVAGTELCLILVEPRHSIGR